MPKSRLARRMILTAAALAVLGGAASFFAHADADLFGRAGRELELGAVLVAWAALGGGLVARFLSRQKMDAKSAAMDPRLANLLRNLSGVVGYGYVILIGFSIARVSAATVLLGGASVGIVLGIAAQSTLGNLFAGLLILMLRPYGVGDRVTVRVGGMDYSGRVREISLFYTVLGAARSRQVVPNALVMLSTARVDLGGGVAHVRVPVPRGTEPKTLRAALVAAGAPSATLEVEEVAADTYTAAVEVPAAFGLEGVLGVLDRLGAEPSPNPSPGGA